MPRLITIFTLWTDTDMRLDVAE